MVSTQSSRLLLPSGGAIVRPIESSLRRVLKAREQVQTVHSDLVVILQELTSIASLDDFAQMLKVFRHHLDSPALLSRHLPPFPMSHVDDEAYANDAINAVRRTSSARYDVLEELHRDISVLERTIDVVRREIEELSLMVGRASMQEFARTVPLMQRKFDLLATAFVGAMANASMIYRSEQSLLRPEGSMSNHLDDELASLLLDAQPTWRWLEAGEVLVEEGMPGNDVFIMLEGTIGVESAGQRLGYHVGEAIIGETAPVSTGIRNATLRALQPSHIGIVRVVDLDRSLLLRRSLLRYRSPLD